MDTYINPNKKLVTKFLINVALFSILIETHIPLHYRGFWVVFFFSLSICKYWKCVILLWRGQMVH